ncbi:MAG: hypothetical protein ACYDBB_03625 [Armatimonadota bacterium]
MRMICSLLLLVLVLVLAGPASTQSLSGPELPELGNLAFGWVSMSGTDPTVGMLTSFAPNMIVVKDMGLHSAGEAYGGQFSFGDFHVTSNIETGITSLGPGLVRVAHYGFHSNTAEVPGLGLPGVLAHTDGDAIELSYAQHVGKTGVVGVSLIPMDSTSISLGTSDQTLISGKSTTSYGVRAGGILCVTPTVKLGANFSYQKDSATTRYNPLLFDDGADPDSANWIAIDGDFITRCGTIGGSWQVTPRTLAYASFKEIVASGSNDFHRVSVTRWGGIRHNLTKNFSVRANYLGGSGNFGLQWMTKAGILNVSYTHRALLNARDILGTGNSLFVGYAVGF